MRDTMRYTTGEEILLAAELEEYDSPTLSPTDERFEELQRELQDPAYYDDVEQDIALYTAVQCFPLSEAVRVECEKEMKVAALRNWSLAQ